MYKFEVGKIYATRAIFDSDFVRAIKVTRRTARRLYFVNINGNGTSRPDEQEQYRVIKIDRDREYIRAGSYSMSDSWTAAEETTAEALWQEAHSETRLFYQWTEKAARELMRQGAADKGELARYDVGELLRCGYLSACYRQFDIH